MQDTKNSRYQIIELLDDLAKRLQNDYDNTEDFNQQEEDRTAVLTAIEELEKDI